MASWCVVLVLLSVGASLVKSGILDFLKFNENSSKNVHCMYSRYMLHYFHLNGIYFKYKFGVSIQDEGDSSSGYKPPGIDAIDSFDRQLRSQGIFVLAMLDQLRAMTAESTNYIPPDDLMQVNLYLNGSTTRVNVLQEPPPKGEPNYEGTNYVKGYQFFYKKMTEELAAFVAGKCDLKTNPIVQDKKYKNKQLQDINQLLAVEWPLSLNDSNGVLAILDSNSEQLATIFASTLNNQGYKDFRPENLLFVSLLLSDVWRLDNQLYRGKSCDLPGSSSVFSLDKSLIPSNVMTNYKINGTFASIHDLLVFVRASFRQNNVILFRQHVFAAVLYPVFKCYVTFMKFVDKFRGKNAQSFVPRFIDDGNKLVDNFQSLIALEIFPKTWLKVLGTICHNFKVMAKTPYTSVLSQKSDIDFLNDGIVKLMSSSNIQFSVVVSDCENDDAFVDQLEALETTIANIDVYVKSLALHEQEIKKGLAIDYQEKITQLRPSDIINTRKLGYSVVINEIGEPPIIKLEDF